MVSGQGSRWFGFMMIRVAEGNLGVRFQGRWFQIHGSGFMVQGAGCRVQGAGCRVQGAGCRVQGPGLGLGFEGSRTWAAVFLREEVPYSTEIFTAGAACALWREGECV